jgi:hypothetical protein
VRYSFSGKITRPRQVLKNGYLSWLDPAGAAFQQARNFDGEGAEIIHIPMPPDTQKANVPLRGLVDRTTGRRQQSRLDPRSALSQRQDERQNWLGIAAAVRGCGLSAHPAPACHGARSGGDCRRTADGGRAGAPIGGAAC